MGLADRHYMRDAPRRWNWSASVVLIGVITAAFVVQQMALSYFHLDVYSWLALSADGLKAGYVWQLLTFQFLHGGVWHLFFNMLGIWFFGRAIEARLGWSNLLKIYFASGIAGGIFQGLLGLAFPDRFGGWVVGASAGVIGLFSAFALFEPDAQILLWFVLPVRARYMFWAAVGIAAFFILVPTSSNVAHAAHLGGLLTGAAFVRWELYARRFRPTWHPLGTRQRKRELVRAASMHSTLWRQATNATDAELPPEEFISKEVDPILDKISAHGLQSLNERERKILEAARKKMEKR